MKTFRIYYTSDTHGYIFPTSYFTRDEKPMGLLNCIYNYNKNGNTLIIDGGDTIQGSPLTKYIRENNTDTNLIPEILNAGGYDYITLGNHDFNFGYEEIKSYLSSLHAQCVIANIIDKKGELNIKPYCIHTLNNGIKLGITGIVTDYVNVWESKENLKYIEVTDAFSALKSINDEIKNQCDFFICIYHGGFERNLNTEAVLSETNENIAYKICQELDVDLLLTAHQHIPVDGQYINDTYTLQLGSNAESYYQIDVEIIDTQKLITSKIMKVHEKHDTELYNKYKHINDRIEEWLDVRIGTFSKKIEPKTKLELALEGSVLADFCNRIQLEFTGAQISCTSLGNNPVGFDTEVSIRNILAAYQFPNTIYVIEVNKEVIYKALERCAEYYEIQDGKPVISSNFLIPKVEHYNYDFFLGIEYTIDISKPVGKRVQEVKYRGKPLDEKSSYTLAMNDYRASGTGGYEFYKKCKIAKQYDTDIQELIIEYIRNHKEIIIEKPKNMKIVW